MDPPSFEISKRTRFRLSLAKPTSFVSSAAAQVAHHAGRYLLPYLESDDAAVRGLAAWALGSLGTGEAGGKLEALLEDHEEVQLYLDRRVVRSSVGDLARQALGEIRGR